MGKFHVGDRWSDGKGDEWLIYLASQERYEVRAFCVKSERQPMLGMSRSFDMEGHILWRDEVSLTRLISSERWIPFTEMMPEHTAPGDKRALLASRVGFEPYILSRTETEGCWVCWRDRNETDCDTLDKLISEGVTHWRYITPPEASC